MSLHSTREIDPFERLFRLQRELERGEHDRRSEPSVQTRGAAFPAVNVFSHRDGYRVLMEVPGIEPQSLELESHGQTLTVSGNRSADEGEGQSVHRRERWHGEFSRSIQLPPDADLATTRATARNGVLELEVERRAEARPRQIKVECS